MEQEAGAAVWRPDVNLDRNQWCSGGELASNRSFSFLLQPICFTVPTPRVLIRRRFSEHLGCQERLREMLWSFRQIAPDRHGWDNCRLEKWLDIFQTILCESQRGLSLELPGDQPAACGKKLIAACLAPRKKKKNTPPNTTQWPIFIIVMNPNRVFTWRTAANAGTPLVD